MLRGGGTPLIENENPNFQSSNVSMLQSFDFSEFQHFQKFKNVKISNLGRSRFQQLNQIPHFKMCGARIYINFTIRNSQFPQSNIFEMIGDLFLVCFECLGVSKDK